MATLGLVLFAAVVGLTRGGGVSEHGEYVEAWRTPNETSRCGVAKRKHCDWLRAFGPVDVGCTFEIVSMGLSPGKEEAPRGPELLFRFAGGTRLRVAPGADRSPFRERPAVCKYALRGGATKAPSGDGEVALLMVSNAAEYLFRLWPLFLNKLLYATDAGLAPYLWIGELPPALERTTAPACLNSLEGKRLGRGRRLDPSFYDGRVDRGDVGLVSNHYVKMVAAVATLRDPGIRGLYFSDLDALAAWPWAPPSAATLAVHRSGASDVTFHTAHDKSFDAKRGLYWRASGSRFYARDSPFALDFFSRWFANRCSFKDQYSLWHTILEAAADAGCVDYDGQIFRNFRYWDAKQLTAADAHRNFSASLYLTCDRVKARCPSFGYGDVETCGSGGLLGDLVHNTIPGKASRLRTFRYAADGGGSKAIQVVNAEFPASGLDATNEAYLRGLGILDRDARRHPWVPDAET